MVRGVPVVDVVKKNVVMVTGQSVIMPAGIPHALYASKQFKMLLTMIKG